MSAKRLNDNGRRIQEDRMNLFDLPIHYVSSWIFNCYVIGGPGQPLVVVDPGLPLVTERAVALMRDVLDRPASDVTTIVSTHGHPDHIGGIAELQQVSGAAAVLPARCRDYLDGEAPRTFGLIESSLRFLPVWGGQPLELAALRQFASLGRTIGFGGPPIMRVDFAVSGYLADGDELAGAAGWKAVHTPGHTDDSTSYYHSATETLISGDAVVTYDGAAWFNPEYVDLGTAKQTEERLRALPVRHLLPGHGLPLSARNVWATARSSTDPPPGRALLARCARRFGRWS